MMICPLKSNIIILSEKLKRGSEVIKDKIYSYKDNKIILEKDFKGNAVSYVYDSEGNLIRMSFSGIYEVSFKHTKTDKGKIVETINDRGVTVRTQEFTDDGRKILDKSGISEVVFGYNDEKMLIWKRQSDPESATIHMTVYDYDKFKRLIHIKSSDGYEEYRDYNKSGDLVHRKIIEEKDETPHEIWCTYDNEHRITYSKDTDKCETYYSYGQICDKVIMWAKYTNGYEYEVVYCEIPKERTDGNGEI